MKILSHCVARIQDGMTNQGKSKLQFEQIPKGCCFFLSALPALWNAEPIPLGSAERKKN
jgi:hypothetical protein